MTARTYEGCGGHIVGLKRNDSTLPYTLLVFWELAVGIQADSTQALLRDRHISKYKNNPAPCERAGRFIESGKK